MKPDVATVASGPDLTAVCGDLMAALPNSKPRILDLLDQALTRNCTLVVDGVLRMDLNGTEYDRDVRAREFIVHVRLNSHSENVPPLTVELRMAYNWLEDRGTALVGDMLWEVFKPLGSELFKHWAAKPPHPANETRIVALRFSTEMPVQVYG